MEHRSFSSFVQKYRDSLDVFLGVSPNSLEFDIYFRHALRYSGIDFHRPFLFPMNSSKVFRLTLKSNQRLSETED